MTKISYTQWKCGVNESFKKLPCKLKNKSKKGYADTSLILLQFLLHFHRNFYVGLGYRTVKNCKRKFKFDKLLDFYWDLLYLKEMKAEINFFSSLMPCKKFQGFNSHSIDN